MARNNKMRRLRSGLYKDIVAFHKKFKLGYSGPPRKLDYPIAVARYRHQFEELEELSKAIHTGQLEGTLDALVDIVYVAIGTAYLSGFDFNEAWKRVHKANMKKVRCATKRSPIDIIKPLGWKPPNLKDLCK